MTRLEALVAAVEIGAALAAHYGDRFFLLGYMLGSHLVDHPATWGRA